MRSFYLAITRNVVSLVGAIVTSTTAILILSLFGIQASGFRGGPYLGILSYILLPGLFVAGLLLIPVGRWLDQRRVARAAERGEAAPGFPVIDLNREHVRRMVLVFFALTTANVIILAIATYNAVEVMDSTEFCGEACHTVMSPEKTTYDRSPHSRVKCVECHIGSGANWFVKSKLSGSWQLLSVAFDLYPRPIPTPVHNLRPARDTCEQCHWPTKYVGDRLQVIAHYAEDEANTVTRNVILLKVGGIQGRESNGIHWHVDPGIEITYTSDEWREHVQEVVMRESDGTLTTFTSSEPYTGAGELARRTMDCVDCHNRPTHVYEDPAAAIDLAMSENRFDPTIPFIRREGMKAITAKYDSTEAGRKGISDTIRSWYAANQAAVDPAKVETAAAALADIWSTNVFPEMNIQWGTYPNHVGHQSSPGCFRCHDGKHRSADGKEISQSCSICHTILAMGQAEPEILQRLNP